MLQGRVVDGRACHRSACAVSIEPSFRAIDKGETEVGSGKRRRYVSLYNIQISRFSALVSMAAQARTVGRL